MDKHIVVFSPMVAVQVLINEKIGVERTISQIVDDGDACSQFVRDGTVPTGIEGVVIDDHPLNGRAG